MASIRYSFYHVSRMPDLLSVVIDEQDKNYKPVSGFFSQLTASRYPEIITRSIKGWGIGINVAGISFPGDFEEDGEDFPENMVEIGLFDDEVQILRMDYLEILLAAANEMLKMQLEKDSPTNDWTEEMQTKIKELEEYIKSPDFTP